MYASGWSRSSKRIPIVSFLPFLLCSPLKMDYFVFVQQSEMARGIRCRSFSVASTDKAREEVRVPTDSFTNCAHSRALPVRAPLGNRFFCFGRLLLLFLWLGRVRERWGVIGFIKPLIWNLSFSVSVLGISNVQWSLWI